MPEPTKQTIKRLFALSGNYCTFPGCSLPMVEKSGTVAGEICHIHAQREGGPRFLKSLSVKQVHAFENLVLMCGHHHTVIDSRPDLYSAEALKELKEIHQSNVGRPEQAEDSFYAQILLNAYKSIAVGANSGNIVINSPGAVQGKNVTINTAKRSVRVQAPPGTIGADIALNKYVSYLIKRYNEFASKEPKRAKFSFGAISANITSKFGAKWQLLEAERSEEVISYLQGRILRTKQARINQSKGYSAFSTLAQFTRKHSAGGI